MSDRSCSPAQIDAIATQLNEGNRAASNRLISECVVNLPGVAAYAQDVSQNREAIMSGEPEAMRRSQAYFNQLAEQERQLWRNIRETANSRNPNGLCQLEIVEDEKMGPHANLTGDSCN